MRAIMMITILLLVSAAGVLAAPPRQDPPIDELVVIETIAIDLLAGPARTAALLAPDGERIAYVGDNSLCLLTLQGEQEWCGGEEIVPRGVRRFDLDYTRWSPDSRYLVFVENFFHYLHDSDIWVFDTTTRTFVNLTDDGTDEVNLGEDDLGGGMVDVAPRWLDAERIVFVRYEGATHTTTLMTVNVTSGEVKAQAVLETEDAVPVYALAVEGDSVYYNFDDRDETVALFRRQGEDVVRLDQYEEPYFVPTLIEVAPDGEHLITMDSQHTAFGTGYEPEQSSVRVYPSAGGEPMLVDAARYVAAATWAPDGDGIAYLTRDPLNPALEGLYLSAGPGQPGRQVLDGIYFPPTPRWLSGITWAANNTLLLARIGGDGLVVVRLGVE